jgi:NAD(P)-dependent dehydrogenase (short-subunit alcohol dehydrogenase family)
MKKGQHILVTGAGTGIGQAIALRLAAEGAHLSLMARDLGRLEAVRDKIFSVGGVAIALSCDIRDREQVNDAFAKAVETHGAIRAMVANSGIGGGNADGPQDRFDDLVQTNLSGTYYCLRAAERHLVDDGGVCNLVMISSCLARFGVPGYTGYCASKAGLLGLNRALALELAGRNVQVNAVCPGWVDTQMARDGLQQFADAIGVSFEEAHAEAMKAVPLGRMSQPEEIAGTVSWLLSEDALGMTGQGIDINAGSWMG